MQAAMANAVRAMRTTSARTARTRPERRTPPPELL